MRLRVCVLPVSPVPFRAEDTGAYIASAGQPAPSSASEQEWPQVASECCLLPVSQNVITLNHLAAQKVPKARLLGFLNYLVFFQPCTLFAKCVALISWQIPQVWTSDRHS